MDRREKIEMTRKQRRLTLIAAAGDEVLARCGRACADRAEGSRSCSFNSPTDGGREARRARHAHPPRRPGAARQRCQRGDNLAVTFEVTDGNRAMCRLPIRACFPICSAKGRASSPKARSIRRRHVQGRQRARQARRDLHAEGSRRLAEEAGPLEGRLRAKARAQGKPRRSRRRNGGQVAAGSAT